MDYNNSIIRKAIISGKNYRLQNLLLKYPQNEDVLLKLVKDACSYGRFRCLEIIISTSLKPIKIDEDIYEIAKEGGDNDCINLIYEMLTD